MTPDLDGAGDVDPVHPDHGVEGGVRGDVTQGLRVLSLPAFPRLVLQHVGVAAPQCDTLEAVVRRTIEQVLVGVLGSRRCARWNQNEANGLIMESLVLESQQFGP